MLPPTAVSPRSPSRPILSPMTAALQALELEGTAVTTGTAVTAVTTVPTVTTRPPQALELEAAARAEALLHADVPLLVRVSREVSEQLLALRGQLFAQVTARNGRNGVCPSWRDLRQLR